MSLTSDIRSYADKGIEQGKAVLDQAQAQLNDVTGQANELVTKLQGSVKENVAKIQSTATSTATDLRAQAEKTINLDAIKAAIEPYLEQAKGYSTTVGERAEDLYSTVRHDKRVTALVTKAEEITGAVVETVQERVVKPVQSLTGLGTKPAAKPAAKASAAKAAPAKAATTRPAAKKAPARKAAAK